MDSHIFDVIIVGAGLAGLSAAGTFIDANVNNILVLEGWFHKSIPSILTKNL